MNANIACKSVNKVNAKDIISSQLVIKTPQYSFLAEILSDVLSSFNDIDCDLDFFCVTLEFLSKIPISKIPISRFDHILTVIAKILPFQDYLPNTSEVSSTVLTLLSKIQFPQATHYTGLNKLLKAIFAIFSESDISTQTQLSKTISQIPISVTMDLLGLDSILKTIFTFPWSIENQEIRNNLLILARKSAELTTSLPIIDAFFGSSTLWKPRCNSKYINPFADDSLIPFYPPAILSLNLSRSNLSSPLPNFRKLVPNLTSLDLSHNVNILVFPVDLPVTLQSLNLESNKNLTHLHPKLLTTLSENQALSPYPSLLSLDMSKNPNINPLPDNFGILFPQLHSLILRDTSLLYQIKLPSFDENPKSIFPSLKILRITPNKVTLTHLLENIPNIANIIPLHASSSIDVSGSNISKISPNAGLHLHNLQELNIRETKSLIHLQNLKSVKIKAIYLWRSGIQTIDPDFGSHLPELDELDLRSTYSLKHLPNLKCTKLKKIYLWRSGIQTIDPNFGSHLTELDELNLYGTNSLKHLPNLKCAKLKKIYLWRSEIQSIDPNFGTHLPELDELDLRYTESLKHLPNLKCAKLKKINLWRSGIQTIDPDFGTHLPELDELDLRSTNSLKHLPNLKCPKLKNIDLSSSSFQTFAPDFGTHLPELEELDIHNTYYLKHLPNLKCPKLKKISLSNSVIQTIDPDFGTHLPELEVLNLRYTKSLKHLPNLKCAKLKKLNLIGSGIQTIDADFGTHLPELEELDLINASYLKHLPKLNISKITS